MRHLASPPRRCQGTSCTQTAPRLHRSPCSPPHPLATGPLRLVPVLLPMAKRTGPWWSPRDRQVVVMGMSCCVLRSPQVRAPPMQPRMLIPRIPRQVWEPAQRPARARATAVRQLALGKARLVVVAPLLVLVSAPEMRASPLPTGLDQRLPRA